MTAARLLLDTNVVVAALVDKHVHHGDSRRLFETDARLYVASHSYAEAYVTLTRTGPRGLFQKPPIVAMTSIRNLVAETEIAALDAVQTVDAIGEFAAGGNIGARVYDYLIGRAGLAVGVSAIITWNTRHMKSLFPDRHVQTPTEYLAETSRS